jgi:hypothetical protein
MYYVLTGQIKNRIIDELRRYWATQPRYAELVPYIQGKYAFKERPQMALVVKGGSGNPVSFSADHFLGIDMSFCYAARVKGHFGNCLEWVREDPLAIQRNNGRFPSPPGLYFIEMVALDKQGDDVRQYGFKVLFYRNQTLTRVNPTSGSRYTISPWAAGSLRICEMPGRLWVPASSCTLNPEAGTFVYPRTLDANQWLEVEYRAAPVDGGTYPIRPDWADNRAIPGVTLAFGQELNEGDTMVVVVQPRRLPANLVYGGQWSLSLDVDVVARDVHAQQYIADRSVMHLMAVSRTRLVEEGLNIVEVSLGGESEEQYDETADLYYFNSNFAMTVETDWQYHVPIEFTLRGIQDISLARSKEQAALSDTEFASQARSNLEMLDQAGLEQVTTSFGVVQAGFPTFSVGAQETGYEE